MTEAQKQWIDDASYETLLRRWRTAAVGDQMFQGDTGDHYSKVMAQKKSEDPDGAVRASKNIGW